MTLFDFLKGLTQYFSQKLEHFSWFVFGQNRARSKNLMIIYIENKAFETDIDVM